MTDGLGQIVVLVVEDEPPVRLLAVDIAEVAGFNVIEAENADESVRILEMRSDIRIIFTDIDMPGSIDGLKLAEAVRGGWPPIEIILTSGADLSVQATCRDAPYLFPNPMKPDSLSRFYGSSLPSVFLDLTPGMTIDIRYPSHLIPAEGSPYLLRGRLGVDPPRIEPIFH